MNTINLLPRQPFTKRYFSPLLILIIAGCMAVLTAMIIYTIQINASIAGARAELEIAQLTEDQLQRARQLDPRSQAAQAFGAEIDRLDKARRQWVPVLDAVGTILPAASSLVGISADGGTAMTASYDFTTKSEIAEYIALLLDSPLIADVQTKSVVTTGDPIIPSSIRYKVMLGITLR